MSGEFGDHHGCFFHEHIEYAADDASCATLECSRQIGILLRELYPICRAISYHEAGDSGADAPVLAILRKLPRLREILSELGEMVQPFADVAEAAVREALRDE